jgi:ankyrin repeat protein
VSVKNLSDNPLFTAVVRGDLAQARSSLVRQGGTRSLQLRHKGDTPLHLASKQGDVAMVGLLMEYGSSLEARNRGGSTALSLAAREGRTGVVKLLLKHGAQADVADITRATPLMLAIAILRCQGGLVGCRACVLPAEPSLSQPSSAALPKEAGRRW